MHSSRMHIVRCSGRLAGVGAGGWCVWLGGYVSGLGSVSGQRGWCLPELVDRQTPVKT